MVEALKAGDDEQYNPAAAASIPSVRTASCLTARAMKTDRSAAAVSGADAHRDAINVSSHPRSGAGYRSDTVLSRCRR